MAVIPLGDPPTQSHDDESSPKPQPRVALRVLGPLEIAVDDEPIPVAAGKLRAVLAVLATRANRTVTCSELIDVLWEGDEPLDARGTVQKYVMRVRHLLDAAGAPPGMIRTEPEGYRLVAEPGQLDLECFRSLTAQAATVGANGDTAAERELLAEALSLWRAVPPLSNVNCAGLQHQDVPELVEHYLRALDRRIELDLHHGRHAELIAELTMLVRRYPHQERFWAHRMRALHRAGRQGEALAAYREVAKLLAEDLGIDPGAELQAAHQEVLRGEPNNPVASPTTITASNRAQQLPRPVVGFVGREPELAQILGVIEDAPILITGMAGMGKTALAVTAAHQTAQRYPDGQLFADLGGCPVEAESRARTALVRFLHALGVSTEPDSLDTEELSFTYRSVLADRRVLILLDNAATAEQVRLLLPGSPNCAVVVTSRSELTGLLVSPGAYWVRLERMSPGEARRLLTSVLGARRVTDEASAVEELIELCDGVALALRIAATQLLQEPSLSVADYVARLRSSNLTTALHIDGDNQLDLGAAFAASCRHLTPRSRRLLFALARLAEAEFTAADAADLAGIAPEHATTGLAELAATNLLGRASNGRYRMHSLVRSFARGKRNPATPLITITPGVPRRERPPTGEACCV